MMPARGCITTVETVAVWMLRDGSRRGGLHTDHGVCRLSSNAFFTWSTVIDPTYQEHFQAKDARDVQKILPMLVLLLPAGKIASDHLANLKTLVDRQLLLQECQARSLDQDKQVLDYLSKRETKQLAELMMRRQVLDRISVTEEQIQKAYAQDGWNRQVVTLEIFVANKARADKAGHLRFGLPKALGGKDGSNLAMAIIREHLAHKGLGLHNDLQNESSIVGNFPVVLLLHHFGTKEQKERYIEGMFKGTERIGFGLTEPLHGSDATFMETTAVKQGGDWVINGMKRFNTGMHTATADLVFARTSGKPGDARGISAFITPEIGRAHV